MGLLVNYLQPYHLMEHLLCWRYHVSDVSVAKRTAGFNLGPICVRWGYPVDIRRMLGYASPLFDRSRNSVWLVLKSRSWSSLKTRLRAEFSSSLCWLTSRCLSRLNALNSVALTLLEAPAIQPEVLLLSSGSYLWFFLLSRVCGKECLHDALIHASVTCNYCYPRPK